MSESLDGSLEGSSDKSFEEDGGHFNRNKDIQGAFEDSAEIQRGPQAILESPVDMGFVFDVENPSSGTTLLLEYVFLVWEYFAFFDYF